MSLQTTVVTGTRVETISGDVVTYPGLITVTTIRTSTESSITSKVSTSKASSAASSVASSASSAATSSASDGSSSGANSGISDFTGAQIGGFVAGLVALFIIVVVLACLMLRKRRIALQKKQIYGSLETKAELSTNVDRVGSDNLVIYEKQ